MTVAEEAVTSATQSWFMPRRGTAAKSRVSSHSLASPGERTDGCQQTTARDHGPTVLGQLRVREKCSSRLACGHGLGSVGGRAGSWSLLKVMGHIDSVCLVELKGCPAPGTHVSEPGETEAQSAYRSALAEQGDSHGTGTAGAAP